ncbi:MAG: SDR family oxidoreductase [Candidatus Faecousia sp.]|nr:SDR family oxidoreductase [Candidatus Faecousia sp.]
MKLAVITGGSRGIGAAAVSAFRKQGYEVAFFYASDPAAAQAVAQRTGAQAIRCDVSDAAAVEAAFARLGTAQVLVNNAAVSHTGLIQDISPAQWDRLFAVNVRGVYNCVRAALPGMLERQNGCILNVASMWGQVGASCEACYSATKGAVIALTKALAKELAPSHIRVNAVSPGVIDTDMNSHLSAEEMDELAQQTPLERIGRPEEVAQALVYLADAQFVTGQILPVNGGFVI